MEWLSTFFYAVAEFVPRLLHITEDMRCIKMSGGTHKRLDPGYHIYWPLIHEIRQCYITRQELDLPEQLLTTADGRTVLVSASIVYRIHGIVKALINTQDYESTTLEVAQHAVQELVTSSLADDVLSHDDRFDHALITTVRKGLVEYGLKVDEAFFTSAAKTKSYHITGIYVNMEHEVV